MDDNDASAAIDLALAALEGQRASHVEMMGTAPFVAAAHVQRPGAIAVTSKPAIVIHTTDGREVPARP